MNKLILATILGSTLCLGAFADDITGYVSEAKCGAKHDTVSEANTKCIEGCLKKGSDPVIVADGKVWKVDADSRDKVVEHAGQRVKIDGTTSGDTVKVNSIEEAK